MNPLSAEWVEKAEGDFATAEREVGVTERPNYDVVCFLAQQCAEKYLKACLQEAGAPFPRIHDLGALAALMPQGTWSEVEADLQTLTAYAVEFRYPGDSADLEMAQEAVSMAGRVRTAARRYVGLDTTE